MPPQESYCIEALIELGVSFSRNFFLFINVYLHIFRGLFTIIEIFVEYLYTLRNTTNNAHNANYKEKIKRIHIFHIFTDKLFDCPKATKVQTCTAHLVLGFHVTASFINALGYRVGRYGFWSARNRYHIMHI